MKRFLPMNCLGIFHIRVCVNHNGELCMEVSLSVIITMIVIFLAAVLVIVLYNDQVRAFTRECVRILKARVWLWFLFIVLAVLVTTVRSVIKTPVYSTTAKVTVAPKRETLNIDDSARYTTDYLIHFFVTQYVLMHNRDLLARVVDVMDLQSRFSSSKGYRIPKENAMSQLQQVVSINYHDQANILKVKVTMQNRELAAEIANTYVAVFKQEKKTFRQEHIARALEKLENKLQESREHLEKLELELEEIKKEQNLTFYDGVNIDKSQLFVFNELYLDARIERLQEEIKLEMIRELPLVQRSNVVAMQQNKIAGENKKKDPLVTLKHLLAQQQIRRADLREKYGASHPSMLEVESKISDTLDKIRIETDGILKGLEIKYEVLKKRETDIGDIIKSARELFYELEDKELEYMILQQEVLAERENYTFLRQEYLRQFSLLDLPEKTIEVIERARVPHEDDYVKPDVIKSVSFSAVSSFFLGMILIIMYGFFEKELFEKARQHAFSLVSVIPSGVDKVSADSSGSNVYEAFKGITMRLGMLKNKHRIKTVLITSSGGGEGKTMVARNLACVLGDLGKRVLVVDANLRKPDLPHMLDMIEPAEGLKNIDAYAEDYRQLIVPIVYKNVDLLPAGTGPLDNEHELDLKTMQALINALQPYYDWIIFDGPPLVGFADSLMLAGLVDEVLMVVGHRMYPQMDVAQIEMFLHTVGGHLMGIILNNVHPGDEIYKTYYQVAMK